MKDVKERIGVPFGYCLQAHEERTFWWKSFCSSPWHARSWSSWGVPELVLHPHGLFLLMLFVLLMLVPETQYLGLRLRRRARAASTSWPGNVRTRRS